MLSFSIVACSYICYMKTDLIINKIREARKELGYTQDQLAQQLNISSNSYKKIESGKTKLIRDRFWQIIDILNIDILDLFSQDKSEKDMYLLKRELSEQKEIYEKRIETVKSQYDLKIRELKAEIDILNDTLKHKETIIGILKERKESY